MFRLEKRITVSLGGSQAPQLMQHGPGFLDFILIGFPIKAEEVQIGKQIEQVLPAS